MKNLIFFLIITWCFSSCSETKKAAEKSFITTSYRVKKIEKNHSWYIIYVERNDTMFKVVSHAENRRNENCNAIVVGARYNFQLRSKKENAPIIAGVKLAPINYTGCYQFDKETTICLEPKQGIYDLFFTDDLIGLCYIK